MNFGGMCVQEAEDMYLSLIHVDIWQKPSQYYKVIICQLKSIKKFLKDNMNF